MKTDRKQPRLRRLLTLATLSLSALALVMLSASRLSAEGAESNEGYEFHGVVQALPTGANTNGDWTVSGKVIHVSAATLFPKEAGDPPIAVGSAVEVKGVLQADGSIVASAIDSDIGGNTDTQQEGEN